MDYRNVNDVAASVDTNKIAHVYAMIWWLVYERTANFGESMRTEDRATLNNIVEDLKTHAPDVYGTFGHRSLRNFVSISARLGFIPGVVLTNSGLLPSGLDVNRPNFNTYRPTNNQYSVIKSYLKKLNTKDFKEVVSYIEFLRTAQNPLKEAA